MAEGTSFGLSGLLGILEKGISALRALGLFPKLPEDRRRWFEANIGELHKCAQQVYDDYQRGFAVLLADFATKKASPDFVALIDEQRRVALRFRQEVSATAGALRTQAEQDFTIGKSDFALRLVYIEALERLLTPGESVRPTWFTDFRNLYEQALKQGLDGYDPARYRTFIHGVGDAPATIEKHMRNVLDHDLPAAWDTYIRAYTTLKAFIDK